MSTRWILAGLCARPLGNAWAWLTLALVVVRCLAVWPLAVDSSVTAEGEEVQHE